MSADRPYRKALRRETIVHELTEGRGTQWDPAPVDVALDLIRAGELVFEPSGFRLAPAPATEEPQAMFSVLLVEDDHDHAELVGEVIRRSVDDVRVIHAADVATAQRLLADSAWSLAVLDHNLPDGSGLDLLDSIRRSDPDIPILMMTGEGSERVAVDAFRRGASDYVVKGENSLSELRTRVRSLLAA
jgi:CheY-like chemotaxis protein